MTTQTLRTERQGYVRVARWSFVTACWLYAVGVTLQVFCIGMVFLAGQGGWLGLHRTVGHSIGFFAILALLSGLFARLPWRLLMGALGLFLLHGLQYAFLEASGGSFVRAFHAVDAVLLFWLAMSLAQQARRVLGRG